MKFGAFNYIFLIFIVPLMILFYYTCAGLWKRRAAAFASMKMFRTLAADYSRGRARFKQVLLLCFLVCCVFTLMQPKWGYQWEKVERRGIDIVVALDTSRSMLAADMKPNRLEAAKREVQALIDIAGTDRIALVAFAGDAFVECPLTLDHGTLKLFLENLDVGMIPRRGTNIAQAIRTSVDAFEGHVKKSRAVILITDGESHEGEALEAAEHARKNGVNIYCVGIGSAEGMPIPLEDGKLLKDRQGNTVITRINGEMLRKIALKTGGAFTGGKGSGLQLEKIYREYIQMMEKRSLESARKKRYTHRFQWVLALALIFLLIEFLISERKPAHRAVRGAVFGLIFGLVSLHVFADNSPRERISNGLEALEAGDYDKALERFADAQVDVPESAVIHYNIGVVRYRMEMVEKALDSFEKALSFCREPELEQKIWFNIGNCHFEMGKHKQAIEAYKAVLKINPNHTDAKFNIEYVRKKIKEMLNKKKEEMEKNKDNPLQKEIKKLEEIIRDQAKNIMETRKQITEKHADKKKAEPDGSTEKNTADSDTPEADTPEKKTAETDPDAKTEKTEKPADTAAEQKTLAERTRKNRDAFSGFRDMVSKAPPETDPQKQAQMKQVEKRLEEAVSHLKNAIQDMDQAETHLRKPDAESGLASESKALESLIRARRAFEDPDRRPPQQKESDDQKKNDKKQEQKNTEKKENAGKKNDVKPAAPQNQKTDPDKKKSVKVQMSKEEALQLLRQLKQKQKNVPDKPPVRVKGMDEYIEKEW